MKSELFENVPSYLIRDAFNWGVAFGWNHKYCEEFRLEYKWTDEMWEHLKELHYRTIK